MSEEPQHFDPDQWVPGWLAKCAEIGADPLLRDRDAAVGYCCPNCDGDQP